MDPKTWVDSYLATDDRHRAALDPGTDAEGVRREALARMHDVTPRERGALIALLSRVRLGNSAIRLFETLIDPQATIDERAVAFIILSNCEPQLIAERPHAVPDLAAVSTRSLELTLDIANPGRPHAAGVVLATAAEPDKAVQLRISLSGIEPPIWRRILVSDSTTLSELASTIRSAMGWTGRHQHLFHVGADVYGRRHPDIPDVRSERRVKLSDLLARNVTSFAYTFDLGSEWRHDVVVEAVLARDAAVEMPVCTSGERACPPENCGGAAGYARLVSTSDSARSLEANAFSVDEANERLARASA